MEVGQGPNVGCSVKGKKNVSHYVIVKYKIIHGIAILLFSISEKTSLVRAVFLRYRIYNTLRILHWIKQVEYS
jgi:hypothetical protein